MMKNRTKLLLPLIAVPLAAGALAAPPAAGSTTSDRAFAEISGCIASQAATDILLVVDESGSLNGTDPGNARVDAMLTAIDGIRQLQQAAPDKQVSVAASSFANDYREQVGWGVADASHIDTLKRFATDEVPGLTTGDRTDYRRALQGARTQLRAQGDGCKVLLWFTDGGLDVGDGTQAQIAEAHDTICTRKGLADSLRSDRVNTIALALVSGDSVSNRDKARLQAIAEGAAGSESCGTTPVPENYARGAYVPVDDAGSLSRVFANAVARITGYTPGGETVCAGADCPRGLMRIEADPGVARVRILASTDSGDPAFQLTPPTGQALDIAAGAAETPGARVEVAGTAAATQIDILIDDPAGNGTWELRTSGGTATVQTWFSPAVSLQAVDPGATVSSEETTEVQVAARTASGQPLRTADYSATDLRAATPSGRAASVTPAGEGQWSVQVPALGSADVPVSYPLQLQLDLTTAKNGIQLDPIRTTLDLKVTNAAGYPQITAGRVTFPDVTEPEAVQSALAVQGSDLGPTTVCLNRGAMEGPAGDVAVTVPGSPDGCLEIPQGQQAELPLQAEPDTIADGSALGDLVFTLTSATPGDPELAAAVPAEMGMSRPVNEWQRIATVIALTLLALAIWLAIVWFFGRRLASFPSTSRLRFARLPVTLRKDFDDTYRVTASGHNSLVIEPDQIKFAPSVGEGRVTEYDLPQAGLVYRSHFRMWGIRRFFGVPVPLLLMEPSATAHLRSGGRRLLASSKNPYMTSDGAPADLYLDRTWFLVADGSVATSGDTVQAELIVFSHDGADFAKNVPARLLPAYLAAMVNALRANASRRTEPPKPGGANRGGSTGGTGRKPGGTGGKPGGTGGNWLETPPTAGVRPGESVTTHRSWL